MLFNSYQIEIEDSTTGIWTVDRSFRPVFKWVLMSKRFLGFFRRKKPVVLGNPEIVAIILKADAHRHARHLHRIHLTQRVRIVRVEHEGSCMLKTVVWQNGEWY